MRRVLSTTLLGLAVAIGGEVARAGEGAHAGEGARAQTPDGAAATVQLLDYDTQTIRVPAGAEKVSVLYPFKLPKNAAPAAVHVVSAMRGGEPITDLVGRLTPEAVEDGSSHERALKLTLALADPIEPGTYDVKLRFELPAADGETPDPLRATVKIMVPAADLHPPAKQVVELIDGRGALPNLVLRETSRRSRITLQGIEPLDAFVSEGKAIAPTLAVARLEGAIGSDDAPLAVSTTGEFPLGTSTGTLRVSAFELSKPVDVEYEVRNKRSLPWIALPILGGLFLSGVLRWLLETRRKRVEALHAVDEAVASLTAEKQRRPDAKLAKALDGVIADLKLKRSTEKKPEGLATAVGDAKTARDKALEAFNKCRGEQVTKLDALKRLLEGRHHVPPGLRVVIADQKAPLEVAAARLDRDDADPTYLDKIEDDLADAARTLGAAWQVAVVSALRSSSKLDALFGGSGGNGKGDVINTLEAALPTTGAKDCIVALDERNRAASKQAQSLLVQLRTVLERLSGTAEQPGPALAAAGKELVDLQNLYAARPDEPEEVLRRTLGVMPDLLRAAVESLIPATTPEPGRKAIRDLVVAGKYLEAADALKEARAADQKMKGRPEGGQDTKVAPLALGEAPPPAGASARIASVNAPVAAGAGDALPWGDVRKLLESEWATQGITLLGTAVVVTLVAVLTHAKTFVGTDEEMLSLLSWAVGLNVLGTESILALLGTKSTTK